jgi:hypothetical protein
MIPVFIHVTTTGEIWASSQKEDSPASPARHFPNKLRNRPGQVDQVDRLW